MKRNGLVRYFFAGLRKPAIMIVGQSHMMMPKMKYRFNELSLIDDDPQPIMKSPFQKKMSI